MQALSGLRRRVAKFFREREDALFFGLCGVVGIVGSLIGAGFRVATEGILKLFGSFHPGVETLADAMKSLPLWGRVALPAIGAFLAGFILMLIRSEPGSGHGVPDVMEVVVLGRKLARVRKVVVRSLASFVGIMTGSSVGREGPLIALATSSAARLGSSVNLSDESYRILTASGVAAGVTAAYHTPLAATLFVVEIIVGVLNMRVLGATVIAAFAAAATSDAVFGIQPELYKLPSFTVLTAAEYPAYAVLGLLCGGASVLFMTCIRGTGYLFGKIPLPV